MSGSGVEFLGGGIPDTTRGVRQPRPGDFMRLSIPSPVAGAVWTWQNLQYLLPLQVTSIYFSLTTSAVAANRVIAVQLLGPSQRSIAFQSLGVAQTLSLTREYSLHTNYPLAANVEPVFAIQFCTSPLVELVVKPQHVLQAAVANLQVADQFGNVVITGKFVRTYEPESPAAQ